MHSLGLTRGLTPNSKQIRECARLVLTLIMMLLCRRHISISGFVKSFRFLKSIPGCAKNFWRIAVYPLPGKFCALVRMGLEGVELDGVEFSGKITPPTSASVLELVGHGNSNHIPTLFFTKVDRS